MLAGDLGLAVGTVARSYRELEAAGLVLSRRGGGTRVAPGAAEVTEPDAPAGSPLDDLAREAVVRARALGAADAEISAALARALAPAAAPASSYRSRRGATPVPRTSPVPVFPR